MLVGGGDVNGGSYDLTKGADESGGGSAGGEGGGEGGVGEGGGEGAGEGAGEGGDGGGGSKCNKGQETHLEPAIISPSRICRLDYPNEG